MQNNNAINHLRQQIGIKQSDLVETNLILEVGRLKMELNKLENSVANSDTSRISLRR
ncbi:MAG: hypothetical protein WA659_06695 [Candidatus Aquirickettsiella sp.]